ncbi:MAG: cation:proton antiporter [Desulfobulbaceae bacterium]|nr:cation:proton antiporter [Desulfobulbaceae bacterium]
MTLTLALLLSLGFLAAKAGNLIKLPSVTGYILAGLLLGPSGFHLVPLETVGNQLNHFTQIALMLISFGIGEHLEIKRLKETARSVGIIGLSEVFGAFILVFLGALLVVQLSKIGLSSWQITEYIVMALLLGAVSVATAPATTLHVMRELRATGPLTTTLMAVVAIDNGLAIMMFGIAVSIAHHLMAAGNGSVTSAIAASLMEIGGSLTLGIVAGLTIDFVNSKLKNQGEMLTAGLAILLLCGELAHLLNFSPLLAGMAAGFTIVNRDHRDLRLFRALNSFEPPIYVLFFTIAGIHLDLKTLAVTGWLGFTYFFCRTIGKIVGARVGAKLTAAPQTVKRYLGMALVPQAGIAIGLIFLISNDEALGDFSIIITPVVLAGVVLSELIGPILAKQAIYLAREIPEPGKSRELPSISQGDQEGPSAPPGVPMVPWTWDKLSPPFTQDGVVIFGANHLATTRALARMAAIFANYYGAYPMAVRIIPELHNKPEISQENDNDIIMTAKAETATMGLELYTVTQQSDDIAQGILATARHNRARGIVLGHCQDMTPTAFQKVIGEVTSQASCPTMVIKFTGILHSERILVPVVDMQELYAVKDAVRALAIVGQHQITLLHLLPSYETSKTIAKAEKKLQRWAERGNLAEVIKCRAIATDARQETITDEAENHDLVIMAAPTMQGLQRLFFGSLAHTVAGKCSKTVITVYPPAT